MSMLARVASNIFWIGRYIERAENTARLIDMGRRIAAMPTADGNRNEWASILASSGSETFFPDEDNPSSQNDVVKHLIISENNPSSVYSCLKRARDNMRSTREGLSSDSWQAMNRFWLDFKDLSAAKMTGEHLADIIDQIKTGCMTIIGATESTILRNETYDFLKLGTYTERSDSTARILDVKYYTLLPPEEALEGGLDTFEWLTILEATSTRRQFRRLYGTDLRAATVVEFLARSQHCARSLSFCFREQRDRLRHLEALYGVEGTAAVQANQLYTSVSAAKADEIIIGGLHEYLGDCIRVNNSVANQIAIDFYFQPATELVGNATPSPEH